jgi:hypothetical protein
MSTLKIQKVDIKKTFDWGKVYTIIGEVDGVLETVEYASKEAPNVGETITGTIEDSPYPPGKKFKKERAGFTPGGGGFRKEDPEKQAMIVRQNALGNAVQHSIAQAQIFMAEKKFDEAHQALEGKTVLVKADTFAKFSLGELKATAPEPTPAPDPLETAGEESQEIDINDIPFD